MKNQLLICCLLLFVMLLTPPPPHTQLFSQDRYQEDLHQYITIEAYHLLRNSGYTIPTMEGFLGTMEDDGDRAWQTSKITTGAYREDKEDVVFLHNTPEPLPNWMATVTHFWNADNRTNNDFSLSHLIGVGDFKNSYEKAYLYEHGNWYDQNGNPSYIIFNDGTGTFHYFMYKNGLAQFYKDNIVWYEKKIDVLGKTIYKRKYFQVYDWVKNQIVWEILGRMCHLLQDQTVPAHAHCDYHGGSECYEDWTKQEANYTDYTRYTAGPFINPYEQSYGNPVRYLYYTANQLGDFWPSSPDCYTEPPQWLGDVGLYNTTNGQGTYPILNQWYSELGTPPDSVNPQSQANWNLNKAISLTASLLYWFAEEADLQQIHPVPTNFYLVTDPSDKNIYRGRMGRVSAYAQGIGMWFTWYYKRCFEPPPQGNWYEYSNQLHGVWYNRPAGAYGNIFDVYNSAYTGQQCSDIMNPLPTYVVYLKALACTNGGWTGFVGTSFNIINGYPGGGQGCPYIFTTSGNQSVLLPENNLLHKAEQMPIGEDVTDRYLLRGVPFSSEPSGVVDEQNLTIVIKEQTDDIDNFDYIKLLRVDHSISTQIGVTENNEIVSFDSLQVISPDIALLNGNDITDNIQYDELGSSIVTGVSQDHLYFEFPNNALNRPAIIMEIGGDLTDPILRDFAGTLTVNTNEGSYVTNFNRRDNLALNIIEIPQNGEQLIIQNASILFNRDYKVKFIALVNLSTDNFVVDELQLNYAKVSDIIGEYNISNSLTIKDYDYLTIDSSLNQTLHLNFINYNIDPSLAIEYILEINGNYGNYNKSLISYNKKKITYQDIKPKLFVNYPNPFNPLTKIKFELPYLEKVELKVYNILGQEIITLVNGDLNEGFHEIIFDGTNLPSGIYIYQLKTGKYTESKKMLLIK